MSKFDEIECTSDPSDIVPNYGNLSERDKIRVTEMIYRRQLKWMYGYKEGETPYAKKREKGEVGGF